jgi:peptide/nickel transport system permease protein
VIRFLLGRFLWAVVSLLAASGIVFALVWLIPADPVAAYAGPQADKETRDRIRKELRLDDPVAEQYLRYLGRLVRGDVGRSHVTGEGVAEAIWVRLPATAAVGLGGLALGLAVGTVLGVVTARRRDTPLDRWVFLLATVAVSVPVFWLARLLQYHIAYRAGVLPVAGLTSWQHLILPCLALGIPAAGYYARLVHTNMVEVLSQDYIRAARARGLPERVVLFKHALRNAFLPVMTALGLDVAGFLGGVVFVESTFALPGLGSLGLTAVLNFDVPTITGTVLFATLIVILSNLAVDLLYPVLDPRVRLR